MIARQPDLHPAFVRSHRLADQQPGAHGVTLRAGQRLLGLHGEAPELVLAPGGEDRQAQCAVPRGPVRLHGRRQHGQLQQPAGPVLGAGRQGQGGGRTGKADQALVALKVDGGQITSLALLDHAVGHQPRRPHMALASPGQGLAPSQLDAPGQAVLLVVQGLPVELGPAAVGPFSCGVVHQPGGGADQRLQGMGLVVGRGGRAVCGRSVELAVRVGAVWRRGRGLGRRLRCRRHGAGGRFGRPEGLRRRWRGGRGRGRRSDRAQRHHGHGVGGRRGLPQLKEVPPRPQHPAVDAQHQRGQRGQPQSAAAR